jgi:hypothetical protein
MSVCHLVACELSRRAPLGIRVHSAPEVTFVERLWRVVDVTSELGVAEGGAHPTVDVVQRARGANLASCSAPGLTDLREQRDDMGR